MPLASATFRAAGANDSGAKGARCEYRWLV